MADLRVDYDSAEKCSANSQSHYVEMPSKLSANTIFGNINVNNPAASSATAKSFPQSAAAQANGMKQLPNDSSFCLRYFLSYAVGGRGNPLHEGEAEQRYSDPPTLFDRDKMLGLTPLMHIALQLTSTPEPVLYSSSASNATETLFNPIPNKPTFTMKHNQQLDNSPQPDSERLKVREEYGSGAEAMINDEQSDSSSAKRARFDIIAETFPAVHLPYQFPNNALDHEELPSAHPCSPSFRSTSRSAIKSPALNHEFKSISLLSGASITSASPGKCVYSAHSFGQDAAFIIKDDNVVQALGIADGVGGWRSQGVDSGVMSRAMMKASMQIIKNQANSIKNQEITAQKTPKQLLSAAYDVVTQDSGIDGGSTTAGLIIFSNSPLPSFAVLAAQRAALQTSRSSSPSTLSRTDNGAETHPSSTNSVSSEELATSRNLGPGCPQNIEEKALITGDNEPVEDLNRTTSHEHVLRTHSGLNELGEEEIEFIPSREPSEILHTFIISDLPGESGNPSASNNTKNIQGTGGIKVAPVLESSGDDGGMTAVAAVNMALSTPVYLNPDSPQLPTIVRESTTSNINLLNIPVETLSLNNSQDVANLALKFLDGDNLINVVAPEPQVTVPANEIHPALHINQEHPTPCEQLPIMGHESNEDSKSKHHHSAATAHAGGRDDDQMDLVTDYHVAASSPTSTSPVEESHKAHSPDYSERQSACDSGSCDLYMSSANLGDSGYVVLRNGRVIYRSEFQRSDRLVKQLAIIPERFRGPNCCYCSDKPEEADEQVHPINAGDIIVVASDGLFDNLVTPPCQYIPLIGYFPLAAESRDDSFYVDLEQRIEALFERCHQQISVENPGLGLNDTSYIRQQLIDRFRDILVAEASEFMSSPYGKPDDLTVIVAQISKVQ
jgi:serine/threonine protein phosphatase PrpC